LTTGCTATGWGTVAGAVIGACDCADAPAGDADDAEPEGCDALCDPVDTEVEGLLRPGSALATAAESSPPPASVATVIQRVALLMRRNPESLAALVPMRTSVPQADKARLSPE
jgi:hypothetical protein